MATGIPSSGPAQGAVGAAEHEGGGLKRAIGPRMLLFFIIGDILGAGIYAISGQVAGQVGGATWVAFLAAFALAGLTAASYAELVGKYPQAAGAALYTHKAFRVPFFTFIVAFAVMASGITSASTAARAFSGRYLQAMLDTTFAAVVATLIAIGFMLVLALINFIGVRESVRFNIALTLIELSGLLIILGIGATALFGGDADPSRALQFETGDRSVLLGIIGGTAIAFFALLGFEDSVNMAEETQEPSRNFPRALFLGLAIAGVVYILVAFVSAMVVPASDLARSSGPLLEVVERAGVNFPPDLFAAIALVAVLNTALLNMLMASRLIYGMANQGVVPRVLGTVHPTRRTPWIAIAFTTLLAVVLIASTRDFGQLGQTTVLLLLIVFAIVNVAVLVLRREDVAHAHFRTPSWAPVLGAVACLVLITPVTGRSGRVYLTAAVLLGIGVLFWFVSYGASRAAGRNSELRADELSG